MSHDALHHYLSSNSSLENGERELGHLSATAGAVKALTILLRERTYSATGNSRVQYLNSPANCILVGRGLYTQFTRPFQTLVYTFHQTLVYTVHQTLPFLVRLLEKLL